MFGTRTSLRFRILRMYGLRRLEIGTGILVTLLGKGLQLGKGLGFIDSLRLRHLGLGFGIGLSFCSGMDLEVW